MKRFIVKKHGRESIVSRTFKVDDQDAYLFRSYVWTLNIDKFGYCILVRNCDGVLIHLKHIIAGAKNNEVVSHINGDSCDYTRKNLHITSGASKRRTSNEVPA